MSQAIKTLALMVTLVSLLLAPGSDSITATENPCKADFERLCGHVKPGQGRIGECLRAHKDETSQECKDFLAAKAEEIRSKIEEVAEACKSDIEKLCKDIAPGEGRILKCLVQHEDKVSEECMNSIAAKVGEVRDKVEQVADDCTGDAERLCKNVEPGEGRILRCLYLHRDSLSPECKKHMKQ